ncbi:MAG: PilZ domain-containing protein [Pyrinomonadaceae bacterium]
MAEANEVVLGETFEVRFLWGRRRHYPRYPLQTPVEFSVVIGEAPAPLEQAHGEGSDISLGGLGVRLPHSEGMVPPVGAHVRLQLTIEGMDEPLTVSGVVAHADAQHGFGISFQGLSADIRKRVKMLLTSKATL